MVKKLGNFCFLIGLLCLVIFFSSPSFLADQAWFFLGGIGLIALGLLIKRRVRIARDRKKTSKRGRRGERVEDDESY